MKSSSSMQCKIQSWIEGKNKMYNRTSLCMASLSTDFAYTWFSFDLKKFNVHWFHSIKSMGKIADTRFFDVLMWTHTHTLLKSTDFFSCPKNQHSNLRGPTVILRLVHMVRLLKAVLSISTTLEVMRCKGSSSDIQ